MYTSFYLLLCFFLAARGSGQFNKEYLCSGWFVRMENNNSTPNTDNLFLEAEILKIFQNIQPQPKTKDVPIQRV